MLSKAIIYCKIVVVTKTIDHDEDLCISFGVKENENVDSRVRSQARESVTCLGVTINLDRTKFQTIFELLLL